MGTACEPDRGAAPREPIACRLLSSEDAVKIIGGPVTAGPRVERAGDSVACAYLRGEGDGVALVKLTVVNRVVSAEEFADLATDAPPGAEVDATAVAGAPAYWETSRRDEGSGTLSALAGDTPLVLQVALPDIRPRVLLRTARSTMARLIDRFPDG